MSIADVAIPCLTAGDKLSRPEFLRRWSASPEIKRAELIGGIVYMPSPVSRVHGVVERHLSTWLGTYEAATPGCEGGNNCTWLMLDDAPQPDSDLRLLPEFGGRSRREGQFVAGAAELVAEVCVSSTAYDLNQKLDLYLAVGVTEYLAVLIHEQEVRWHRRVGNIFELLPMSEEGIIQSVVFPGLWLQVPALLRGDLKGVLGTLNEGLGSPAHAEFIDHLRSSSP